MIDTRSCRTRRCLLGFNFQYHARHLTYSDKE